MLRQIALMILLLCLAVTGEAQLRYLPQPEPADSITISLLTCAPGAEVYQLEGHSGLRMQYGENDLVANWGVFDFDSPGFAYRFCKGETDYMIAVYPLASFLIPYSVEGRRVTCQRLALTRAEAAKVLELVDRNLLPENRVYRYNYVLDNCATRPVAIIEQAVADSIRFNTPYQELGDTPTFRSVMSHFHSYYPWYQFSIDLALGSGVDQKIDTRLTMFAPAVLCRIMATATVGNRPIVDQTTILIQGDEQGTPLAPTPWYLTPLTVASLICFITLVLVSVSISTRRLFKGWYALLFTVQAIGGLILTFLCFFSVHEATSPNILLFWLNPLCLLVPALIFSERGRRWLIPYMWANLLMCLVPLIGAIFGAQVLNAAFYPLIFTDILLSANYILFSRDSNR